MQIFCRYQLGLFLLLISWAGGASAGLLIAPHVGWNLYAFRPSGHEDTPNYYGYGLGSQVGYSAAQIFDMALYYDYTPGNLKSADPFDSNSEFAHYGAALGLRLYKTIYFGFHGGVANYALPVRALDEEVEGRWRGIAYGAKVGALIPMTRTFSWQVALGMTTADMKDRAGIISGTRKLDLFSLSISLVYNNEDKIGFVDAIFSNSIESLFK